MRDPNCGVLPSALRSLERSGTGALRAATTTGKRAPPPPCDGAHVSPRSHKRRSASMPSKRVKIQSQTMVDAIQERAASLAAAGHAPQSATTCAASELARGAWPKVSPQVSARVAAERERLQRLVADRRSSPPPTTSRDGCKEQLDEARRAVERRAIAPPSRPAATTKAAEPPKKGKKKEKKARKPSQALSAPSEAEEVQQDMEAEIKARLPASPSRAATWRSCKPCSPSDSESASRPSGGGAGGGVGGSVAAAAAEDRRSGVPGRVLSGDAAAREGRTDPRVHQRPV